jgi:hypothetical protein
MNEVPQGLSVDSFSARSITRMRVMLPALNKVVKIGMSRADSVVFLSSHSVSYREINLPRYDGAKVL